MAPADEGVPPDAAPLPAANVSRTTIVEGAPAPAKPPTLLRKLSSRRQAALPTDGKNTGKETDDKDRKRFQELEEARLKKAKAEEARLKKAKAVETELAGQIRDYIIDHQDDVAQEERWRTTMKRDMAKSFRATDSQLQTVVKELEGLRAKLNERDTSQEQNAGAPSASHDTALPKSSHDTETGSQLQMILTELREQRKDIDGMRAVLEKMHSC